MAHFPLSPQTGCCPGDEGIMSRLAAFGWREGQRTDGHRWRRGCGHGRTQLSPSQRRQLTTVSHGYSRDLKPATEASQKEPKPRGAEEQLTGRSARGVSFKAHLSKSLGSHSVSDPTTHRPLRLSRGGRQLNDSVGISPTKSNPSSFEVPRGRGRPPRFQPSSPGAVWQLGSDGWTAPPRD